MILSLKTLVQYCYTLEVERDTSILELKHILQKRHRDGPKPQLYEANMNLFIFKLFQYSIFQSLSDDIISSIANKMKYRPYYHTPICKILIILGGRRLEDDKTIEYYNLYRVNAPTIVIK